MIVLGFTLLWQSPQAIAAQMLEISRSMGRLKGTITRLEQRMDQLAIAIGKLTYRVDRLETR